MRFFSRLAVLVSAAFIVMFSAGCDPDTPGLPGTVTLPPVVTLNGGAGVVSFNQELPVSSPSFIVNISGADGDAALRDLAILEAGAIIPAAQLNFRTGQTAQNPILTTGADASGFTYEIEITPTNTAPGPVTFTFRLTDADGETASTEVTITYIASPPTADLLIEDGIVSGDVTIVSARPSFDVKLQYAKTEADVATVTILENGTAIDASRLLYNDGAFTAANPLTLVGAETEGGTFKITITPEGVTMNETRTYTFVVTDADGQATERTITVMYEIPPNDLTLDTVGIFFNASGAMFGGLDLDNGAAVPYNSPDAEIEDEGVNERLATGEKWRAQISASNDAELRIANLTVLGDGITFDDVELTTDIARAFDEGEAMLGGSDDFPDTVGDDSADETVTTVLNGGEVFAVRRGDRTYLVRIDEVNYVANSNNDNYAVSIKY